MRPDAAVRRITLDVDDVDDVGIGANLARHEIEVLLRKLTASWTNLQVETEIDVEANIFAPAVRSFGIAFDPRDP
ncbi:MAG: hypothetical protein U5R31_17620 [Acidimicrobiia bacterium]|nr:hypothetical protein [Acidimicrobiia bacterium]